MYPYFFFMLQIASILQSFLYSICVS